jgi:SSS family solute:Na+ symporter
LTSAIYNEVLQFLLIVLGFLPLSVMAVMKAGGWQGISARLPAVMTHSWTYMGHPSQNPMGVDVFGLVMGLGFVLSFGYWCTDFLVVQRAMAANSMAAARKTPLVAALPKMFIPFIVIMPGIAAVALSQMNIGYALPMKNGGPDYDQVLTTLMAQFYPAGMLGVGLTGLMASFMSGMAGNVTAFNTVFTYDIYQTHIRPNAQDRHYLHVGRITTIVGVGLSIGTAYLAQHYNNIMDLLQMVFSFVNAPLFATFMLGMFWKRATGHGAFVGLLSGTGAAALTHGLTLAERKGGMDHDHHRISVHHGAELLDRHFRVDDVLPGDHRGEPDDETAPGGATARAGIRHDRNSARGGPAVVPGSGGAGCSGGDPARDLERHLLVKSCWTCAHRRESSS